MLVIIVEKLRSQIIWLIAGSIRSCSERIEASRGLGAWVLEKNHWSAAAAGGGRKRSNEYALLYSDVEVDIDVRRTR